VEAMQGREIGVRKFVSKHLRNHLIFCIGNDSLSSFPYYKGNDHIMTPAIVDTRSTRVFGCCGLGKNTPTCKFTLQCRGCEKESHSDCMHRLGKCWSCDALKDEAVAVVSTVCRMRIPINEGALHFKQTYMEQVEISESDKANLEHEIHLDFSGRKVLGVCVDFESLKASVLAKAKNSLGDQRKLDLPLGQAAVAPRTPTLKRVRKKAGSTKEITAMRNSFSESMRNKRFKIAPLVKVFKPTNEQQVEDLRYLTERQEQLDEEWNALVTRPGTPGPAVRNKSKRRRKTLTSQVKYGKNLRSKECTPNLKNPAKTERGRKPKVNREVRNAKQNLYKKRKRRETQSIIKNSYQDERRKKRKLDIEKDVARKEKLQSEAKKLRAARKN